MTHKGKDILTCLRSSLRRAISNAFSSFDNVAVVGVVDVGREICAGKEVSGLAQSVAASQPFSATKGDLGRDIGRAGETGDRALVMFGGKNE